MDWIPQATENRVFVPQPCKGVHGGMHESNADLKDCRSCFPPCREPIWNCADCRHWKSGSEGFGICEHLKESQNYTVRMHKDAGCQSFTGAHGSH